MSVTEDWEAFAAEAYSRNAGILTDADQAGLRECRLLVAGCGSVGGAVVEPLIRLGLQTMTLADPDVYALHNLNRQACVLDEINESKPVVLARRASAINPHARIATVEEGITPENVDSLVGAADLVFDGVDIGTPVALWAKYLVHDRAAARGIPVLSGVDLGGQPTIFVWDYRDDPRPFFGRTRTAAFREGKELEAALGFVGLRRLPRDFIEVIRGRAESGAPWPQITYAADGIGVLASRAVVDLCMARPVSKVVSVDVHMQTRRSRAKLAERVRWPAAAVGLVKSISGGSPPAGDRPDRLMSEETRCAVEAVRRTPSAMNSQPWLVDASGDGSIRLRLNPQRDLGAIDPDGTRRWMSIGCSLESLAYLFDEARIEGVAEDGFVVSLPGDASRQDWLRRRAAVLQLRHTNRGPYRREPLPSETLAAIVDRAAERQVDFKIVDDAFAIGRIARAGAEGLTESMRTDLWWHDYLKWVRVSRRDYDWDEDGVDARALGLRYAVPLFRGLKRKRLWRYSRLQLQRLVAEQWAMTFEQSAAILLLSVDRGDGTPQTPIALGRAMMACWTAATSCGVAVQPLSDIALSGDGDPGKLVVPIRIGYPLDVPSGRSARLPMSRIVEDA